MKCSSEKNQLSARRNCNGFTLPEVMAAVTILGIICSGVFVIIDKAVDAAINMEIRMNAFKVAQQNMEKILCSRPIEEQVDYGVSEIYPAIEWETNVEVTTGPYGLNKWVRAICTATYYDADDEPQEVEFEHWVSKLTPAQEKELLAREGPSGQLADQILDTIEQAADYAGVTIAKIRQWERNSMPKDVDRKFIKMFLDLYKDHNGSPPRDLLNLTINRFNQLQDAAANQKANKNNPVTGPPTGSELGPENPGLSDNPETIPDMPSLPENPFGPGKRPE